MNAYVEPAPTTAPAPLTSEDISTIFKKAPGWFARDAVRKRLYAKGFPKPFERGLWARKAVFDWLDNPQPPEKPKPRSRRPNAYAPVEIAR